MKKKIIPTAANPAKEIRKHLAAVESSVLHQFPALVQHCCVTAYDDGDPRKPGWFTVKTMGSSWVIQLKDPDAQVSLTATAQTLDDALSLAELLISGDDAPWEPDHFLRAQGTPKKGKQNA